jgi:luciferase family oxidoreductase group 1
MPRRAHVRACSPMETVMPPSDLALSILEFGYTRSDGRLRSGLEFTLALAQLAEECGYARFWHTEHHDANLQIACPEVVIAAIAATTRRIRVGSAGILLNYYSPFKVAEIFHTLAALFPDRIDLGIARASGAEAEAANLLRDGAARPADAAAAAAVYECKIKDVIGYLGSGYQTQRKLESSAPLPGTPEIWLMGSGTRSAALAAKLGTRLAMTLWYNTPDTVDIPTILADYAAQFQRAPDGPPAKGCIALTGICAETNAEAEAILAAAKERNRNLLVNFCGSPERCRETIVALAARHGVREVVIDGKWCDGDQQTRMFRLLAEAILGTRRAPRYELGHANAA